MLDKNCNAQSCAEDWQPLPNVRPSNLKNKLLFCLRLATDFQMLSVYRDIREWTSTMNGKVLEVVCGEQPYRDLLPRNIKYYGIDKASTNRNFRYLCKDAIYYEGDFFPFKNGVFGFVFHTEVLEHVFDLKNFLSECNRMLTKGGAMFFTTPFAARYHYMPNDYWRFTPSSLKKILEDAGFWDIIIRPRGNDITVAIAKINSIFYRIIFKKFNNRIFKAAYMLLCATLFAIPVLSLTIFGHLSLVLRAGSLCDPLG